jgi:uncharacterized protein YbjT (DUF2867 family)
MEKILVTGATGQIGGAVVEALADRRIHVRAAARNAAILPTTQFVEPVIFDYEDATTHSAVLSRVTGIYLVAPPLDPNAHAKMIPFIDMAKEAGVQHMVFNSAMGMEVSRQTPLRIVERHLMGSGLDYTILRPNFFMENFTTGFIGPMIARGEICLAAGEGKTSFISVKDIAEAAAAVFLQKKFGTEYNLTGPEALDYRQVARIISDASGRMVTYSGVSEEDMLQEARKKGMPSDGEQYLAMLYRAVRNGWMAVVTSDLRAVTGKDPVSFVEFAQRNSALWRFEEAA